MKSYPTQPKAHSALREFIEYEVDKFDTSRNFNVLKKEVRDNLQGIANQISSAKLYKRYNIFANNLQQKRKQAKMILQASKCVNLEKIVKTWNSSLEKEELDRDYQFMFENCMAKGSISIKMLTQYSQYARTVLLMR